MTRPLVERITGSDSAPTKPRFASSKSSVFANGSRSRTASFASAMWWEAVTRPTLPAVEGSVKRERDVVRHLGPRELRQVGRVEHEQERALGAAVEHDREQHAVVLGVGIG